MSKFSMEDAIKYLKEADKNIIPDKIYTTVTNYPNQGDQYSCTGKQLLETREAYLSLFEAEKSGDIKRIAEAITKIASLKEGAVINCKSEDLEDLEGFALDFTKFLAQQEVKEDDIFILTRNGIVISEFTGASFVKNVQKQINLQDTALANLKKKAEEIRIKSANN